MALDFLKSVFGGGESTQQSTSTPVDMTPAAYKGLQPQLAGSLSSLLSSGVPQYSGPTTAGLGANEQSVLGQLMSSTGPGTERSQYLDKALSGGFLPGQPGANPYLDAAIKSAQEPTRLALEQTLGRTLPGRFTMAGQSTAPQGSSAFDRAAAMATGQGARALSDIATNMSYAGYESERNRQTQAAQLSQAEVDTTIKNLQAQGLPRMIQQHGIELGMQLFQDNTKALLEVLKLIGGVTSPTIANQGQSTGTQETEKGILPGIQGFLPKGNANQPAQ